MRILMYVEVFIDDCIALTQRPIGRRHNVRQHLFHEIDRILCSLNGDDTQQRKGVNSLKELEQGDGTWATEKEFLRWVIHTITVTIGLPERRVRRLWEILDLFPRSQKRTSLRQWSKVIGKLRQIALPRVRRFFSQMQEAICRFSSGRVTLSPAVHQDLANFHWILDDPKARPTRLYELVPLVPTVDGYHNDYGTICGGVLLPGTPAVMCTSSRDGAAVTIPARPSNRLVGHFPRRHLVRPCLIHKPFWVDHKL